MNNCIYRKCNKCVKYNEKCDYENNDVVILCPDYKANIKFNLTKDVLDSLNQEVDISEVINSCIVSQNK